MSTLHFTSSATKSFLNELFRLWIENSHNYFKVLAGWLYSNWYNPLDVNLASQFIWKNLWWWWSKNDDDEEGSSWGINTSFDYFIFFLWMCQWWKKNLNHYFCQSIYHILTIYEKWTFFCVCSVSAFWVFCNKNPLMLT